MTADVDSLGGLSAGAKTEQKARIGIANVNRLPSPILLVVAVDQALKPLPDLRPDLFLASLNRFNRGKIIQ
jgi:hypothetical protein